MTLHRRVLLLTFVESFATILVERGVYFYCRNRLGFTDVSNLWLAFAGGISLMCGALVSHAVCRRLGERRMVMLSIAGLAIVHALLAGFADATTIYIGAAILAGLQGLKWPVVESYISAGLAPEKTASAVGQFSVAWASAVPLAMIAAGPIIAAWPAGLYVLAGAINLCSLLVARHLPDAPDHMPHDHPDRPSPGDLDRLRRLLVASRWLMLSGYAALFILSPLVPRIFADLGFAVWLGTALAGVTDVARMGAFAVFQFWTFWHGRIAPLAVSWAGMCVGFFMAVLGQNVAVVLGGEILFGLGLGLTYYGALYYAMVVQNASVDAGGKHEGLIGLGFAIGPLVGLGGAKLALALSSDAAGYMIAVGAMFAIAGIAAAVGLVRRPATGGTFNRSP